MADTDNEHLKDAQTVEEAHETTDQQALDDLTVLANVQNQNMGDARLNVSRAADVSDASIGNLANIIPGSAGDHINFNANAAFISASEIAADQVASLDKIPEIGTLDLNFDGGLAPLEVNAAPPKIEINTAPQQIKSEEPRPVNEVNPTIVSVTPTTAASVSTVINPTVASENATVANTEIVEPHVNHSPVITSETDAVTANDHSTQTGHITANDPDGDTVSYRLVDPDTGGYVDSLDLGNGTVTINVSNGEYTFTPNADQNHLGIGETSQANFQAVAIDSNGAVSAPVGVDVTVTGSNDGPMISGTSDFEGQTNYEYGRTISGDIDATDADTNDTLTYSIVDQNEHHGNLTIDHQTGEYTYTATDSTFTGQDVFTVQVSDGNGGITTHEITINDQGMNVIEVDFTREVEVVTHREVTSQEAADVLYKEVSETETTSISADLIYKDVTETHTVTTSVEPIYHDVTTATVTQEAANPIYRDVTTVTTETVVDTNAMVAAGNYQNDSGEWVHDVITTNVAQESASPIYKEVTHTNITQVNSDIVYKTVTETSVTHEIDTAKMAEIGAYVNESGQWVHDVTSTNVTQEVVDPVYKEVTTTTTTSEIDTAAMQAEGGYQVNGQWVHDVTTTTTTTTQEIDAAAMQAEGGYQVDGQWVHDVTTTTTTEQEVDSIYKLVPVDDWADRWGNNGWGNGDQDAPGNSGSHNNAENDRHSGGGHSGGGRHDRDGHSGGGHSGGGRHDRDGHSGGGHSGGGRHDRDGHSGGGHSGGGRHDRDGHSGGGHSGGGHSGGGHSGGGHSGGGHSGDTIVTVSEVDTTAMTNVGNYQVNGQWVHDVTSTSTIPGHEYQSSSDILVNKKSTVELKLNGDTSSIEIEFKSFDAGTSKVHFFHDGAEIGTINESHHNGATTFRPGFSFDEVKIENPTNADSFIIDNVHYTTESTTVTTTTSEPATVLYHDVDYYQVVDTDAMSASGAHQNGDGEWVKDVTTTTTTVEALFPVYHDVTTTTTTTATEALDPIYHDVTHTTTTTVLDTQAMTAAGGHLTTDGTWVHDVSHTLTTTETATLEYHDVIHETGTQVVDTDAMVADGSYQNTDGEWVHSVTTTSTETVLDTQAIADQGIYQDESGQWVHDVATTSTSTEDATTLYHDVQHSATETVVDTQAMADQGIYQDESGQWVHDVTHVTATQEVDTQAMSDAGNYQTADGQWVHDSTISTTTTVLDTDAMTAGGNHLDSSGQWVYDMTETSTHMEVDTQAMTDAGNYQTGDTWVHDVTGTVTDVNVVTEHNMEYISLGDNSEYDDAFHLMIMSSDDGHGDWTAQVEQFDFVGHDVIQSLDQDAILHVTHADDSHTLFVDHTNLPS